MKSRSKRLDESQPHIAIIIPFKTKSIKFKPIPIEYISGDGKEELCIINESLKIDATGITTTEIINDFIKKFLENWDRFQRNEPVKNYLYNTTPNISPNDYHDLKRKYFELIDK